MRLVFPALVVALQLAAPALARILVVEPEAQAGTEHVAAFRVAHGCGGSPTVSLRIEIPAAITSAKPQPKPGWIMRVERAPLPQPVQGDDGLPRLQRVAAVTWMGRLDPDQFDEFRIWLQLPDGAGPLYFPTLQRCEQGEAAWTATPKTGESWKDLKQAAPMLEVSKAPAAPAPRR
jgi:periplasmic copper chaperone A